MDDEHRQIPIVLNQRSPRGTEVLVNLPPCDREFTVWIGRDGETPVALTVDGKNYRVESSKTITPAAKYRVAIVERGYPLPLKIAWEAARAEARELGVPVTDREPGAIVMSQERARELLDLLGAIDQARAAAGRRRTEERRAARRPTRLEERHAARQ